jgi:eukaryotic-like serine/threonine-protein kinase
LQKVGAGGMGEVYLAQDLQLERTVALKVLPADVASDERRMQRFIREAKTASALNHPNILTIFEIGHDGDAHFIATEFIEGETLRQHIKRRRMKLAEVLTVAIQTADALAAAHEAGIIHRDIKPENIMLRQRDAYVKVLDFGLAKLIERDAVAVDPEALTKSLFKTAEGMVVGTVIYMSPEQAAGLQVDARTDIWSLGVVLYEMVSGCLPFEGSTTSKVLASILNEKEPPLARFARDAPAELERIVSKALRKDREQRYQVIKDMLLDLKSLKQRLEFEAELERVGAPQVDVGVTTVDPSSQIPPVAARASTLWSSDRTAVRPATSAEYLVGEIKRHKRSVAVGLCALILAAAAFVYFFYFAGKAQSIDSIAVLPLVNASGDPNTDYLSDGISEALINSLTELRQLKVIARSTAFRYKGREVDPKAVGRELNVRAVLMGWVRQRGDLLNVQVDLVDATTGAQLWGAEYERKILDVLTVKQAIAREVMDKLRLRLSGEEQQKLVKGDTSNSDPYQFYLRGRYFWNKRTADGIRKAVGEFQQAIDRDPNYALGYVGLADCYILLELDADVPSAEILPKARAAVDRALQIDDSLAEAHTSSARIYQSLWRWAEVDQEFKRAISLNPNYPTTHLWFSVYLRIRRQFDDALREIKRAQELDPLSLTINRQLAAAYLLKNDIESAVEQCQRTIELDPSFHLAHETLGWAYLKQRRYEEATAEFQKAVELSGRASNVLGFLGYSYAVAGRRAEARAVLKELEERYARREAAGQDQAAVYVGLGDKDQAFAWLERDFEQRSGQLPFITYWFSFEDLRGDPRYADLVRRMGLTP